MQRILVVVALIGQSLAVGASAIGSMGVFFVPEPVEPAAVAVVVALSAFSLTGFYFALRLLQKSARAALGAAVVLLLGGLSLGGLGVSVTFFPHEGADEYLVLFGAILLTMALGLVGSSALAFRLRDAD